MATTKSMHPLSEIIQKHPKVLVRIETWDDFETELAKPGLHDPPHWAYRGQKCICWGLQTSLERRAGRLNNADAESWLLREFMRRYHHYSNFTPNKADTCYWLSLMQHHGAPTRLLDWTYSRYVAAFFAVEEEVTCSLDPVDPNAAPAHAVYALNVKALRMSANDVISRAFPILGDPAGREQYWDPFRQSGDQVYDGARFDVAFRPKTGSPHRDFVYPVNSYLLNERLTIQQGLFLAPGNVLHSFEQNLTSVLPSGTDVEKILRVYAISPRQRGNFLLRLNRMNINRATLFPGLDGFASSLRHRLLDVDLVSEVRKLDEEAQKDRKELEARLKALS